MNYNQTSSSVSEGTARGCSYAVECIWGEEL